MTTEQRAPALSDVELVSCDALELHPDNPRQGDLGAIVTSIETNGWFGALVAQRSTRRVLVGNHRLRAAQLAGLEELPVHWVDVDEPTARRILLADNRTSDLADYDRQDLAALLREAAEADDLLGTGFDAEDLDDLLLELGQGAGQDAREAAAATLQQRFGLFPSSILDTRRSWWQERKRAWLALGVRSELGRGDDLLSMPVQMRDPQFYAKRTAKEAELGREISTDEFRDEFWTEAEATFIGTSIFDPVLCEIAYRWFCPPAGRVLDPFAGGSVRGIVAALLGRSYTGVDLRDEQLVANRANWSEVSAAAPGLELEPETQHEAPEWIAGDSAELEQLVAGRQFDMAFTCPPYFDLEVYSDDPADLSNCHDLRQFRNVHGLIIEQTVAALADDSFIVWVIGEARGPSAAGGVQYGLVADTIKGFQEAGAHYYNDAVMLLPSGSWHLRVGNFFTQSRKIARLHQPVLIFVKGDPVAATARLGEVEWADSLEELARQGILDGG